jgi:elongation factor P
MFEGRPCQVLTSKHSYKAQGTATILTKLRDLLTGAVSEQNFRQGDTFDEAEIGRQQVKFLFAHRGQFTFVRADNPAQRFIFDAQQLGESTKYLVPNTEVIGIEFEGNIVNIEIPIKMRLKIKDAPPGIRGDRAQGGTKTVVLETGTEMQVPLFVHTGDIIEVNTETGEYVERVEKAKE